MAEPILSLKQEILIIEAREHVIDIFSRFHIDASNSYKHAIAVMETATPALNEFKLNCDDYVSVIIACLFHGIDDKKNFKADGYPRVMMFFTGRDVSEKMIAKIIKMISLVSFSKNGNTIDPKLPKWYYIPRDANRINCAGKKGIERVILYNKIISRPLIVSTNDFVRSLDELKRICDPDSDTDETSLMHFYKTNWFKRRVMASGSRILTEKAEDAFDFLENWVIQYCGHLLYMQVVMKFESDIPQYIAHNYKIALDVIQLL